MIKKTFMLTALLACSVSLVSQVSIYSENFDSQEDKGAIGSTIDLTGVDWTIDVSNVTLSNNDDWFKVEGGVFEGRDLDGGQGTNGTGDGAVWMSPSIDISTYTDVSISVDVSESGTHENQDFIKVSYILNGGSETQFGFLFDDFPAQTFSTTGLSGNSLQVVVEMDNNAGGEFIRFDNVEVEGILSSTNDTDSEAVDNSQPGSASISSVGNVDANNPVDVFSIGFIDNGSGDALPTQVTKVRLKPHTTNTADWTDHIQGVVVDDGTNFLTPLSTNIDDAFLEIEFTSGDLDVADGDIGELNIAIFLNTSDLEDGAILSFFVDADDHGFMTDNAGSAFAGTFPSGDFNSNDFTVDVEASLFTFSGQPSDVVVGAVMSPAVEVRATDANGNVDKGYNLDIPLSSTATFDGAATTSVTPVDGIATFSNLLFSAAAFDATLTAETTNDGVFVTTTATSDLFDVLAPETVIISIVAEPNGSADTRFVQIQNIGTSAEDLTGWTLELYANGSSSATTVVDLSGQTLDPDGILNISPSASVFESTYGCAPDITNGGITGNGDDTYALFNGATLVDVYGEIGVDGTGEAWEYVDRQAVRSSVTAANSTWTASEWSISSAAPDDIDAGCPPPVIPDNDECVDATPVSCGTNLTGETTAGSTQNGAATGCTLGRGVWYVFSGTDQNITITADGGPYSFDLELAIASSIDCSSFNNVICRDNFGSTGFETHTFFANEGVDYYIYVAYFSGSSSITGSFDLSVTCANASVSTQTTGNCYGGNNVSSTGSGAWLNITDGGGDLIASVLDSENMGTISSDVFINNGAIRTDAAGVHFLDRNVSIDVSSQPTNPVLVRFYITNSELNALVAADSDVNSSGDLNASKENGGCQGTYDGSGTLVEQAGSSSIGTGHYLEYEVASFSNFLFHAGLSVLPVDLVQFDAKPLGNYALLNFSTASESSNSHFLIERSVDGRLYNEIGKVQGMGTTSEQVDYEFVDEQPLAGRNHYRLKQVDYDGAFEYFGPVTVEFDGEKETTVRVYPTVVSGALTVELAGATNQDWTLSIIDISGRTVVERQVQEKALRTAIDVEALPRGTYFMRWKQGVTSGQERFIKQ